MTPGPTIQSLLTVTERPFNAETPLPALEHAVTPSSLFFVRCNFDIPVLDPASWQLAVEGSVARPAVFSMDELRSMPFRSVHATIECAGNGRTLLNPVPAGTAWGLGAVSTGVFGGTPLRHVLNACGLDPSAVELVFEGADRGPVEDGREVRFVRSLPREQALHADTLLAWMLNDAPLEPAHGHPLRLFVPGWYGVASVKWLARIVAVNRPFAGHFQTDRYVYRGHPEYEPGAPVTFMHVRSLITNPAHGSRVAAGRPVRIRGIAWSGFGDVRRVAVSVDAGSSWSTARLLPASSARAAVQWESDWRPEVSGDHVLVARAEDSTGNVQPFDTPWNELGYGNNTVHRVGVRVTDG